MRAESFLKARLQTFAGHRVSVATTQLCPENAKAAPDNTEVNEHGSVPRKLFTKASCSWFGPWATVCQLLVCQLLLWTKPSPTISGWVPVLLCSSSFYLRSLTHFVFCRFSMIFSNPHHSGNSTRTGTVSYLLLIPKGPAQRLACGRC